MPQATRTTIAQISSFAVSDIVTIKDAMHPRQLTALLGLAPALRLPHYEI